MDVLINRAAWILQPKGYPFVVDAAPLPEPGPDEVVIKNHAVAINPVDGKVQAWDIFLKSYPNILGADVAGEVHQVGKDVTHVQKGDRVIGHSFSLVTNDPRDGGFQLYTSCASLVVCKIPASLPYTSAAVLPLSISTAASCLFKRDALALPYPSLDPEKTDKSVLVWGGSTSVGASAIQLAAASGVTVITVSGPHNMAAVRHLGATHVFDYHSESVARDIVAAVRASGTTFLGLCDCIGEADAVSAWTPVYRELGGRYGSVLPAPQNLPQGIEGASVFAPNVAHEDREVGEKVWREFLPEALERGVVKASPEALILRGGLGRVQEGVDRLREGVSFRKVVVGL